MRAGRLRRVIVVQSAVETRSGTGAIIQTWGTFLTARAEIAPIKGNEPFASAHFRGESTIAITMRYRAGITDAARQGRGEELLPPAEAGLSGSERDGMGHGFLQTR